MRNTLSVLFDAYWLVDGPPSGRNVVDSLVSAWMAEFPQDRLALAVPKVSDRLYCNRDLLGAEVVEIRPKLGAVHRLWVELQLGRHGTGFDAIISQNFTPLYLRSRKSKTIGSREALLTTFVHDLLFVDHREWFTLRERLYLAGVTTGLRRTGLILTSSAAEAKRIARLTPERASIVHSVGLGVPRSLAGAAPSRPHQMNDASSRQFLLAVGRLNVRKNLARLIEAYLSTRVAEDEFDLLIVGEADGRGIGVMGGSLPSTVKFLGRVSDGELLWLYQNCKAFVFPSLDEGFGLPLVESSSCGAIVLASDIPAFREMGIADILFDPLSVSAISRAIAAGVRMSRRRPGQDSKKAEEWSDIVRRIRSEILRSRD